MAAAQDKLEPEQLGEAYDALLAHLRASEPGALLVAKLSHAVAVWDAVAGVARIEKPKGTVLARMGRAVAGSAGNSRLLWPEEALYLAERGDVKVEAEGRNVGDWRSELLGTGGSVDMHDIYAVYSELKSAGYTIARAGMGFVAHGHVAQHTSKNKSEPPAPSTAARIAGALVPHFVFRWLQAFAPMLSPLASALVRFLLPQRWIKRGSVNLATPSFGMPWHYDVWKPSRSNLKLSNPGEPDFVVAVVRPSPWIEYPADFAAHAPTAARLVAFVTSSGRVDFIQVKRFATE